MAVYVALYFATAFVFSGLLLWVGGYLTGVTGTGLLAAIFANWLALRIYRRPAPDSDRAMAEPASAENLLLGLGGGMGRGRTGARHRRLLVGAAHLVSTPDRPAHGRVDHFREHLAGGGLGGRGTVLPRIWISAVAGGVRAVGDGDSGGQFCSACCTAETRRPAWFSAVNTAGFGILFGYGYLRSRDLWLPIGLHFGWNFTLPLFGVNVSGLRMKVTGYEMAWNAGSLWSGGEYGPEASILTSAVLVVLFVYLWKAPIRRQFSPLTDPPAESAVCEVSPSLPS